MPQDEEVKDDPVEESTLRTILDQLTDLAMSVGNMRDTLNLTNTTLEQTQVLVQNNSAGLSNLQSTIPSTPIVTQVLRRPGSSSTSTSSTSTPAGVQGTATPATPNPFSSSSSTNSHGTSSTSFTDRLYQLQEDREHVRKNHSAKGLSDHSEMAKLWRAYKMHDDISRFPEWDRRAGNLFKSLNHCKFKQST